MRRHGAVICNDLEILEIQLRDVPFRSRHEEVMNYLKYPTTVGLRVSSLPKMIIHRDFYLKPDT